ncbi:unnamed protein product [Vitrella brassicaformis CCMP3155]|uniref:non-specific serine/threonine protein kinase n=4 Tax=Vitrella brassicaformis TaxID=1169539 RepID=A0A0G4F816_VITBC|nr:unnamed protein product [Vitrella brassicaformis CCMP3155]|eukprot:CEM08834.1 unnamed protein product [Vitrella brassicaformis CCMP3155]
MFCGRQRLKNRCELSCGELGGERKSLFFLFSLEIKAPQLKISLLRAFDSSVPSLTYSKMLESKYLADLKSKNESVRAKAAKNLRIHVEAEAKEMSGGTFTKFMADLNKRIYDLVSSPHQEDKIGGIMAIDELIDVQCDENETKIIRFSNYLRMIFQQCSSGPLEHSILPRATRALGHLARAGGTMTADFVEFELRRSLECLQSGGGSDPRSEYHRYAAVLILKELALNAPVLFGPHVNAFFDHIWVAIQHEPKTVIREAGVEALRAVLQLLAQRDQNQPAVTNGTTPTPQVSAAAAAGPGSLDGKGGGAAVAATAGQARQRSRYRTHISRTIWEKTQQGLRSSDALALHGSLLAVGELLTHDLARPEQAPTPTDATSDQLVTSPRFAEICDLVFKFKSNRHRLVQRTVLQLLPTLAKFDPASFVALNYLDKAVAHLLQTIRSGGTDRELAFEALGDLILAVKEAILPYVDRILTVVHDALSHRLGGGGMAASLGLSMGGGSRRRQEAQTQEALICISKLAKAVGPQLAPQIEQLVDKMFVGGLSPTLLEALNQLCKTIPSLLPVMQNRLLHSISLVLADESVTNLDSGDTATHPSQATSAPSGASAAAEGGAAGAGSGAGGAPYRSEEHARLVVLALHALGQFGTLTYNLQTNSFVCECVLRYLDHPMPAVRKEAALTAIQLLLPKPFSVPTVVIQPTADAATQPSSTQDGTQTSAAGAGGGGTRASGASGRPTQAPNEGSTILAGGFLQHVVLCRPHQLLAISRVIRRLLTFAVADPEASIRHAVLEGFDFRFDPFLCEPSCLAALNQSLHDESLQVRKTAVRLMGRLCLHNPAYVLPALRKILIQLLTDLEFAPDARHRDEAAELLGDLILEAQQLMEPYATSVIRHLITKLKETQSTQIDPASPPGHPIPPSLTPSPSPPSLSSSPPVPSPAPSSSTLIHQRAAFGYVSSHARSVSMGLPQPPPPTPSFYTHLFTAVGYLSEVGGTEIRHLMDDLLPILVEALQDTGTTAPSGIKREVAFRTLSQIVRNTGAVLEPYLKYPSLLSYMIGLLRSDSTSDVHWPWHWPLRKQIIRAIGTLGALDPYRFHQLERLPRTQPQQTKTRGLEAPPLGANEADHRNLQWENVKLAGERHMKRQQEGDFEVVTGLGVAASRHGMPVLGGGGGRAAGGEDDKGVDLFSSTAIRALLRMMAENKSKGRGSASQPASGLPGYTYWGGVAYGQTAMVGGAAGGGGGVLSSHQTSVMTAMMCIFKNLEHKTVYFLPQVMPAFLDILHSSDGESQESLLLNLSDLIAIVGAPMARYLPALFDLLTQICQGHLKAHQQQVIITGGGGGAQLAPANIAAAQVVGGVLQAEQAADKTERERGTTALLRVLEEIATHLPNDFETYMGQLIPILLNFLQNDQSERREVAFGVLQALGVFGKGVQDYIYLVVPALTKLAENEDAPPSLRIHSIYLLGHLTHTCTFPQFSARIGHALIRILDATSLPATSLATAGNHKTKAAKGKTATTITIPLQPPSIAMSAADADATPTPSLSAVGSLTGPSEMGTTPTLPSGGVVGGGRGWDVGVGSEGEVHEMKMAALQTLAMLYRAFGADFAPFVPLVKMVTHRHRLPVFAIFDPFSPNALPTPPPTNPFATRRGVATQSPAMPPHPDLQSNASASLGPSDPFGAASADNKDASSAPQPQPTSQSVGHASQQGGGAALMGGAGGGQQRGRGMDVGVGPLQVHQQSLKQAWETNNRSTREEWAEWMRRFSLELLRESPSPALRTCWSLSQVYQPLSKELFPVAFLSCWLHLYDTMQDALAKALEQALQSPNLPPDVLQTILNLAEFMEHQGSPLPLDYALLGGLAEKSHAYAKALHYKEREAKTAREACVEALISLNNQLGQREAATGVLVYAQKHLNVTLKESWYEKLHRWEDALEAYEIRQLDDRTNLEWTRSRMRCLHALGEWDRLSELSRKVWDSNHPGLRDPLRRHEVAYLAAAAEFNLRKWDKMNDWVAALEATPSHTYEGCFYSALLAIHQEDYRLATRLITKSREILDPELTALVGESYERAYGALVKVQQLTELEEIIAYKQTASESRRQMMRKMWATRLQGCQPKVEVWQAILQVRSMVLPPTEDIPIWLRFCSLCRKQEQLSLSINIVKELLTASDTQPPMTDSRVVVAHLKNLYAGGHKETAQSQLRDFCTSCNWYLFDQPLVPPLPTDTASLHPTSDAAISDQQQQQHHPPGDFLLPLGLTSLTNVTSASALSGWEDTHSHPHVAERVGVGVEGDGAASGGGGGGGVGQMRGKGMRRVNKHLCHLLSKCHLKLGLWTKEVLEEKRGADWINDQTLQEVLLYFRASVRLSPTYYKAWNAWANTNFHVVQLFDLYKSQHPAHVHPHACPPPPMVRSASPSQHQHQHHPSLPVSPAHPHHPSPYIHPISHHPLLPHHGGHASDRAMPDIHTQPPSLFAEAKDGGEGDVEGFLSAASSVADRERVGRGGMDLHLQYVVEAVRGFVKSIALGTRKARGKLNCKANLQDVLRLLTLWFRHAGHSALESALQEGFQTTPLETWLEVIPQILARLRSSNKALQKTIHALLKRIGKEYPQALVFPLTVASKSAISELSKSARQLLQEIEQHFPVLVQQSLMVSEELIRVSILWHEQWYEALEEASRLYYSERDIDGMVQVLLPLHNMLRRGPQTLRETAFIQAFGRDLEETESWIKRWKRHVPANDAKDTPPPQKNGQQGGTTKGSAIGKAASGQGGGGGGGQGQQQQQQGKERERAPSGGTNKAGGVSSQQPQRADIDQAWQIYYRVFQKIHRQIQSLTHLDLQYVSPNLLSAKDLQLAVPGTYKPDEPPVRILAFTPSIQVVNSKQKPRILQMEGSDGLKYKFLLKGHEDLKQDERVMQVFGLINDLLLSHSEASQRDLAIARYAVVPLSTNSGLIEWVPHCDTLHSLIKMYRDANNITLSLEHNLMKSMYAKCDDLCLLQKVEVFQYALDCTSGEDLEKMLWLQSSSSEVWLARRTVYCRSLAVMSMVGYILGLGDRHPSNLMLTRSSGRVVHIDFGDCFEVAALRERFPEKIPFRLTRMLLNALEISGVEGNFRHTCELVMGVLRSSKDTLMAMLEAFVDDPLITWRLLPAAKLQLQPHQTTTTANTTPQQPPLTQQQQPPTTADPLPSTPPSSDQPPSGAPLTGTDPMGVRSGAFPKLPTHPEDREGEQAAMREEGGDDGGGGGGGGGEGAVGQNGRQRSAAVVEQHPREPVTTRTTAAGLPPGGDLRHGGFPQGRVSMAGDMEKDPHMVSTHIKQSRQRELKQYLGPEGMRANPEMLSTYARSVIRRVDSKLSGTDFGSEHDIPGQVERLIQEATSHENLCQCYLGWCPFW